MGARIRTSGDAIAYAMSLCRLVTRATFTPGASSSSNRVTVGPATIPTSFVSTPCSARARSSVRPVSSSARLSTSIVPDRSSSAIGGSFHPMPFAPGPRSISSCSAGAGVLGRRQVERRAASPRPSVSAWAMARSCPGRTARSTAQRHPARSDRRSGTTPTSRLRTADCSGRDLAGRRPDGRVGEHDHADERQRHEQRHGADRAQQRPQRRAARPRRGTRRPG